MPGLLTHRNWEISVHCFKPQNLRRFVMQLQKRNMATDRVRAGGWRLVRKFPHHIQGTPSSLELPHNEGDTSGGCELPAWPS